jgi:DNA-directed RNA polymerase specialized sigma24 family protein
VDGQVDGLDDCDDWLSNALPAPDDGPEAVFLRKAMLGAISVAVTELPAGQREVFLAHELEGKSFKELAAESGVSLNTLLGRKRLAVQYLRLRLQSLYDEQSW